MGQKFVYKFTSFPDGVPPGLHFNPSPSVPKFAKCTQPLNEHSKQVCNLIRGQYHFISGNIV